MLKRIITIGLLAITLSLFTAQITSAYAIPNAYAPENTPFAPKELDFNSGINKAPSFYLNLILQIIAGGLLYVVAPFTVIMIALAAFNMVMGGDDPEKVGNAKKALMWAVLGLILVILSYSLVKNIISIAIGAGTPQGSTEESAPPAPPDASIQYAQTADPLSLQRYLA
ncbi:MAG: pilin [Candidatus Gracilibacteria bacterium]